jgi:hypothetical protein
MVGLPPSGYRITAHDGHLASCDGNKQALAPVGVPPRRFSAVSYLGAFCLSTRGAWRPPRSRSQAHSTPRPPQQHHSRARIAPAVWLSVRPGVQLCRTVPPPSRATALWAALLHPARSIHPLAVQLKHLPRPNQTAAAPKAAQLGPTGLSSPLPMEL